MTNAERNKIRELNSAARYKLNALVADLHNLNTPAADAAAERVNDVESMLRTLNRIMSEEAARCAR